MDSRVRARVEKIVNALKLYEPERVFLFGSAARGDADEHSDIDIAVIKDTPARFLDRLETVYDLIAPDFALDVLVYTPQEFADMQARKNPFVTEILRDGVILFEPVKQARESKESSYENPGWRKQQAEQEARRWFTQSEYDLRAAQINADNALYSYACFIAQQAAEKALKAFLYGNGERDVKGHSVSELCRRTAQIDPGFLELIHSAAKLDRYYIPTRYPDGLPGGIPSEEYDKHDANQALVLAHQIIDAVSKHVNV